ncbi:MAG: hypothetical protein R6V54_10200 [Desulfobacteraceae bacterium]
MPFQGILRYRSGGCQEKIGKQEEAKSRMSAMVFSGAWVMPPFDRFDLLPEILPAS